MATSSTPEALPPIQRQYLLLMAYVMTQHRYFGRASTLIEGLFALGEDDQDLRLARAAVSFLEGRYEATLRDLEWLEASRQFRTAMTARAEVEQVLIYMRARCLCQTGRREEGENLARSALKTR